VGRWNRFGGDDDPVEYLRIMDAAGVDRACVFCSNFGDARRGNDLVARFIEKYPDRFIGVAYVTPRSIDEAMSELERCFETLDFKFLKVYPDYFGKSIDDSTYAPIFQWANERNLVIMSHSSGPSKGASPVGSGRYRGVNPSGENDFTWPTRFIGIAQRYQQIKWVLAHSGNARPGQEQAIAAAKVCPNIFLETCTSMAEHDTIELLVSEVGEDRILYGSDMPVMDARFHVGRVITADISDDAKVKVLGLNAIKLLGLEIS
jgi:predicted TIM-barrel fold metal-dependent hydrolase